MALHGAVARATRTGQGGDTVKHGAKRYLAVGFLGVALLLGLAAGVAAARGGSPAAAVPDAAAVGVPGDAATGGVPYRLSPPNEGDTGDGAGALRASEARGVY